MADKQTEWAARMPSKQDRPRVLFPGRMVVFSPFGMREQIRPESQWNNGFSSLDEAILAVGPKDLRPENHQALIKQLAAAVVASRAKDISPYSQSRLNTSLTRTLTTELLDAHPDIIVQHLAEKHPEIYRDYGSPERIEALKNHSLNIYELKRDIARAMDIEEGGVDMQAMMRAAYDAAGLRHEMAALEKKGAEFVLNHWLNYDGIHDEEARKHLIGRCLKTRVEGGREVPEFDFAEMKAIRQEMIDMAYGNVEIMVNAARQAFSRECALKGIARPFENTTQEKRLLQQIDEIANRDAPGKPLVLAGYRNPKLTIVLEEHTGECFEGISYEGQDMIRVSLTPRSTTFESVMVEELMHQGMDKIYRNDSLPYRRDSDNRKALLERAVTADEWERPGDVYPRLGLSSITNYVITNMESMHKEVPVKLLKMMGSAEQAKDAKAFPALQEFVRKVVLGDAVSYLLGKPLTDIRMDYSRKPVRPEGAGEGEQRGGGAARA